MVLPGRLHLATAPSLLRVEDRASGTPVQFLLMPYPTPTRYLEDEASQKYQGLDEKNRHLMRAFTAKLHQLRDSEHFNPDLPAVLAAHIAVRGSELPTLFRLSDQEDIVFSDADLPTGFAYVALGHIHKAQCLGGQSHVRYSGSIERMDLGESLDNKQVVLFDIGPEGLQGEPWTLPMESTPVYEVNIFSPKDEMPEVREKYKDAKRHLVKINRARTRQGSITARRPCANWSRSFRAGTIGTSPRAALWARRCTLASRSAQRALKTPSETTWTTNWPTTKTSSARQCSKRSRP